MFTWPFGSNRGKRLAPRQHAGRSEEAANWLRTSAEDWTVPNTFFDTAGWTLSSRTSASMSWIGEFGGTLTFTNDDVPQWTTAQLDVEDIRRKQRSTAHARGGGLVSAAVVTMENSALALEVITKYRSGTGFRFEGRLFVDESPHTYTVAIDITEQESGLREALVSALRARLGELDLAAILAQPADPVTGARPVPGMRLDPYDPAFDHSATYSASDDPRLDDILPAHALSVVRRTLLITRATWESTNTVATPFWQNPFPEPPGPRLVLSDRFFTALREMVEKH
jgi:hypothetical protein